MVQTIVSGVMQEIRSSFGKASGTSPKPVLVPTTTLDSEAWDTVHASVDSGPRRVRTKGVMGRSRSSSPTKRKSVSQEVSVFESGETGDGLAVLLKACEILDKDSQNDLDTPQSDEAYDMSPRKAPRSPAKSPRKGTRSSSPSKTRPQGPCTNPHCMNPMESPQWRRGPSEAPVLCNACGTRWIRNKSLIPIVPQRGIRYNKSALRSPKKTHPKEGECDNKLDMEELALNVKIDSQPKSNRALDCDLKKSVFTLVASIPSQHSIQPPQGS